LYESYSKIKHEYNIIWCCTAIAQLFNRSPAPSNEVVSTPFPTLSTYAQGKATEQGQQKNKDWVFGPVVRCCNELK
jgi:hypothetical protein